MDKLHSKSDLACNFCYTSDMSNRKITRRRTSIRLVLRTNDLARLFQVHPRTIKRWLSTKQLVLTEDPVQDFLTLAEVWRNLGLENIQDGDHMNELEQVQSH